MRDQINRNGQAKNIYATWKAVSIPKIESDAENVYRDSDVQKTNEAKLILSK